MSVALMAQAFRLPVTPTQKLVLLALCDCANDQGECYPSVPHLEEKTSLSERSVQGAVRDLEVCGVLRRHMRSGRATVYRLTPAAYAPPQQLPPAAPAPTPAAVAPPPPQHLHHTPAAPAPRTIKEPSVEPSLKRKSPARAPDLPRPDGVAEQVWVDWLTLRKAKRAPVTQTVIDGAIGEAAKADMPLEDFLRLWCRRGTQGLEASWLKPNERGKTGETDFQRSRRENVAAFTGGLAARRISRPTGEIIDAIDGTKRLG